MATVTIYSTPSCVYCKMAKDFFEDNKIAFEEKDVARDLAAREEMIQRTGQMGVPVIQIDSETIIGFDKERIASLLGVSA